MTEPLPKVPVETIIEKIDKPKSSSVAIKIMVGLLILVILSEVGYLLYNNYFKSSTPSLSGPSIQQQEDSVTNNSLTTPTNSNTDTETKESSTTPIVNNINQEIIFKISDFLSSRPDILYKNGSVSFTIEAKISHIISESTLVDGINYPLKLVLQQGDAVFSVYFTKNEYLTAKVTDPFNPEDKLDLKDLNVGDNISISLTSNLINNPNFNSKIFITILE